MCNRKNDGTLKIEISVQCTKAVLPFGHIKETTLERADFTLQLLMFVTAEKEGQMFIIFFLSIFCQLMSPGF